jgi:hypothetical protein
VLIYVYSSTVFLVLDRLPAYNQAGPREHLPEHALEEQGPRRCHQVPSRHFQGSVKTVIAVFSLKYPINLLTFTRFGEKLTFPRFDVKLTFPWIWCEADFSLIWCEVDFSLDSVLS